MKPVKVFWSILGVGFLPAVAVGGVVGVSNTNYEPLKPPAHTAKVNEDLGNKHDDTGKGRVEFVTPTPRATPRVTPEPTWTRKTPHARRSTSDVPERVAVAEESSEPTTPPPTSAEPVPTFTNSPAPTKGGGDIPECTYGQQCPTRPVPSSD